jgi:hypothetical protein
LRLTLDAPLASPQVAGNIDGLDPAHGRAALVALRRNLFPHAPAFVPEVTP